MGKVISGLSSLERAQVDFLNEVNQFEHKPIPADLWANMSACAILGHLIEAIDKEEIQMLLDQMEEGEPVEHTRH